MASALTVQQTDKEITTILDFTVSQIMRLGIKAVSMDDLSRGMGMSKKTLYEHFSSKYELIEKALLRHILLEEQVINEIHLRAVDAIDEMAQIAEHTVIHFEQISPVLIHDLMKYYQDIWGHVVTHQTQFIQSKIGDNIRRGIEEGYYRGDVDIDVVIRLYGAKSFSLVDETLFDPRKFGRDRLIRQHILYHLHGILSDQGRKHLQDFHALMT